jgi:hypothetical protein
MRNIVRVHLKFQSNGLEILTKEHTIYVVLFF